MTCNNMKNIIHLRITYSFQGTKYYIIFHIKTCWIIINMTVIQLTVDASLIRQALGVMFVNFVTYRLFLMIHTILNNEQERFNFYVLVCFSCTNLCMKVWIHPIPYFLKEFFRTTMLKPKN